MGKGMNLDEFREALSSEARIQNEELKAELEKVKTELSKNIKELQDELKLYKDWCTVLGNRCHVLTGNELCIYCQVEGCTYFKDGQKELEAAAEYMTKNKLPRNKESIEKVNKFRRKWRKNKK